MADKTEHPNVSCNMKANKRLIKEPLTETLFPYLTTLSSCWLFSLCHPLFI